MSTASWADTQNTNLDTTVKVGTPNRVSNNRDSHLIYPGRRIRPLATVLGRRRHHLPKFDPLTRRVVPPITQQTVLDRHRFQRLSGAPLRVADLAALSIIATRGELI